MIYRLVFNALLALLAIRNQRDLFYKPVAVFAVVYAIRFATETLVSGFDVSRLTDEIIITAIVASPFLVVGMAIVTHMEKLHSQLADLAATDMLTDLPNRRAFMAAFRTAIDAKEDWHMLIIDVDHFKRVNDKFGHAVGDQALIRVASHLRQHARMDDKIGRLGGEEFGMLVRDRVGAEIEALGETLTKPFSFNVPDNNNSLSLSVSVGATPLRSSDTIEAAFVRADRALYDAKLAGRAQMVICDDEPEKAVA